MQMSNGPLRPVRLVSPSLRRLPAYAAALRAGWSPNTVRDVSQAHLRAIARDPEAFVRGQAEPADRRQDALVRRILWVWDGELCGAANLRFAPGTVELPPGVAGHVGFSIVPAKRGEGRGRQALAGLLDLARSAGLPRVSAVCAAGNVASRRVVEANGGRLAAAIRAGEIDPLAQYWIATERAG